MILVEKVIALDAGKLLEFFGVVVEKAARHTTSFWPRKVGIKNLSVL